MILKCVGGGPMRGAAYVLSRDTSVPEERSTNRKPDGFWFDGRDKGCDVRLEYEFDRNGDGGTHLVLEYKFKGSVRTDLVEQLEGLLKQHTRYDLRDGFSASKHGDGWALYFCCTSVDFLLGGKKPIEHPTLASVLDAIDAISPEQKDTLRRKTSGWTPN